MGKIGFIGLGDHGHARWRAPADGRASGQRLRPNADTSGQARRRGRSRRCLDRRRGAGRRRRRAMLPDPPTSQVVLAGEGGVFDSVAAGHAVGRLLHHPPGDTIEVANDGRRDGASGYWTRRSPAASRGRSTASCRSWSAARPRTSRPPSRSSTRSGRTIVHVGPSGSGQAVKAANQLVVGGTSSWSPKRSCCSRPLGSTRRRARRARRRAGRLAGPGAEAQNMMSRVIQAGLPHRPAPQGHGHRPPPRGGRRRPAARRAVAAQLDGRGASLGRRQPGPLGAAARCRGARRTEPARTPTEKGGTTDMARMPRRRPQ